MHAFATVSRVTDLLTRLGGAPGLYRGRGDGPEGGPFVARIAVATVLRGRAVTLDYEAVNDRNGLQHVEHTVLATGEGGRLELHVACLELPGVVRFVETGAGTLETTAAWRSVKKQYTACSFFVRLRSQRH